MTYKALFFTMTLLAVVSYGICAPAGTGKVERRDSDKVAALKVKLQKLHHLLQELYDDNTKEAETQPPTQEKTSPTAAARSSEDMISNIVEEAEDSKAQSDAIEAELGLLKSSNEKQATNAEAEQQGDDQAKDEDDSLQALAKALAHLRDPEYTKKDTTGEYLSSRETRPRQKPQRYLEEVIKRAMSRLNQERESGTLNSPFSRISPRQDSYATQQQEDNEEAIFHVEALRAVELKLMRDVMAAKQLGVSVDEIIGDLEGKAYQEAELKEVERQLVEQLNKRNYV